MYNVHVHVLYLLYVQLQLKWVQKLEKVCSVTATFFKSFLCMIMAPPKACDGQKKDGALCYNGSLGYANSSNQEHPWNHTNLAGTFGPIYHFDHTKVLISIREGPSPWAPDRLYTIQYPYQTHLKYLSRVIQITLFAYRAN